MKLDHLVYFTTENPEVTVEEQKKSGRNAIIGGSHKEWGTQNVLLYTQNAYIEWLSVENMEVASKSDLPLIQLLLHDQPRGKAWGTICLLVNDIESYQKKIKEKGFEVSKIYSAQRQTPEGKTLRWKMLFVLKDSLEELPYPFFIEWEESEEERYQRLSERGAFEETNKDTRIKECNLATSNPKEEAKQWGRLLDRMVIDGNKLILPNIRFEFVENQENKKSRLEAVLIT